MTVTPVDGVAGPIPRQYWRTSKVPLTIWVSGAWIAIVIVAAIGGELITPHDPFRPDISLRNLPPMTPADSGLSYIMGTDPLGRDVFSRILIGARISIAAGFASVALSGAIGLLLGVIAGYRRGRVEIAIMRAVDLQMSLPSLLVAIFVLYILGPGFVSVVLVLALSRWMIYARVSRAMVLTLREQPFIEASIALGSSDARLIREHLLPNIRGTMVILATLELPLMLLSEAALDFLGLGIQPPDTSWGLMLADGREYMSTAWWLVFFPGFVLAITAAAFSLVGSHISHDRGDVVTSPEQLLRKDSGS